MNRRALLISVPALAGLGILAACSSSSTTSTAVTSAQVLADINGAENVAKATVAAIQAEDPNAISPTSMAAIVQAEAALTAATSALTADNLSNTGMTTLQQIDSYLNDIFSVVGAVLPVVPSLAPYIPMYDATVVLITDVIEPYINGLVNAPATPTASATAPLKTIKSHPTPAAARTTIGVPTV